MTGDRPRLVRFGQLTLPPGAVVAGEIVDVDLVAGAIRRLWERVGFRSRQVVLGLANQRVIVRQAEMPRLDEAELTAALRFEAADLLPIAAEDATLDFQVLQEFVSPAGEPRLQLLLAAAQRTMLDVHMRTCQLAGLRVIRADPMPLALVRSLGRTGLESLEESGPIAEAIVCVGAGITTVVIHEDGIPRFARFLSEGAGAATNAVASELGVDLDTAEDLKRRVGAGSASGGDARADVAVSRVVTRLVDEIDNSLRFFTSQAGAARLGRVLLAGSGSRLAGLHDRLAAMAGVPVEAARPSGWVSVEAGLSPEEAERAEPNLPSVIGLALAAGPLAGGRRINLLPTEVTRIRSDRTQYVGAGAVVIGAAALLGTLWVVRGNQVNSRKQATQDAQTKAAALNQQIGQLTPQTQIQQTVAQREQQVRSALAGDVDWARLITQVASAMPDDVWLTSLNGTSANAGTPQISVNGKGLSQPSTAAWIERIENLASITDLWVSSSTGSGNGLPVAFTSNASLTSAANSDRLGDYTGKQP
jgi:type IV pilus assembly protein PilM